MHWSRSLSHGENIPEGMKLDKRRYGVGIAWSDIGQAVDLDLQAVIVDDRGHIVDAVYYNNLSAMRGAVQHTGDTTIGGEMIWVMFRKLPERVKMIVFVVAACGNGRLRDAMHGSIQVCSEFLGQVVKKIRLESTKANVDVVATMVKAAGSDNWYLNEVDAVAERGQNFLDILEPTIGDIIRANIIEAPMEQKVCFSMEKGASPDMPTDALRRVDFKVVGELSDCFKRVDIDVSAIFYNSKGSHLGAVYCDHTQKFGVIHSGESAKDEDITVDLTSVPNKVHQIYFLVQIYTKDRSFADMRSLEATLTDQSLKDVACFSVNTKGFERGLVVCRLRRAGNRVSAWEIDPINKFCGGPSWSDSLPETDILFKMSASEILKSEEQLLRPILMRCNSYSGFQISAEYLHFLRSMGRAPPADPNKAPPPEPSNRPRALTRRTTVRHARASVGGNNVAIELKRLAEATEFDTESEEEKEQNLDEKAKLLRRAVKAQTNKEQAPWSQKTEETPGEKANLPETEMKQKADKETEKDPGSKALRFKEEVAEIKKVVVDTSPEELLDELLNLVEETEASPAAEEALPAADSREVVDVSRQEKLHEATFSADVESDDDLRFELRQHVPMEGFVRVFSVTEETCVKVAEEDQLEEIKACRFLFW